MKFYMFDKTGKYEASGELLSDNKFKVYESSKARYDQSKSQKYTLGVNRVRDQLLNVTLVDRNGSLTFNQDYTFTSPSLAAAIVKGQDCNGWHEWKNKEGNDLDSIYRKWDVVKTTPHFFTPFSF